MPFGSDEQEKVEIQQTLLDGLGDELRSFGIMRGPRAR